MGKFGDFLLLVLGLFLFGCSSGPSTEEIAASVEARLAVAQAETEAATVTNIQSPDDAAPTGSFTLAATYTPNLTNTPNPTDTPVPTNTPNPTETPTPTTTPIPTNIPKPTVDWGLKLSYPPTSYFEVSYDQFESFTVYAPLIFKDAFMGRQSVLFLSVGQKNGERPNLLWSAFYHGDDWIFIEGVKIRIADTTYDLSDRVDYFDVDRETSVYGVDEDVSFPFLQKDAKMIESLLANASGAIRLDGSDGNADIPLTSEIIYSWFAALALYQSLGGNLGG